MTRRRITEALRVRVFDRNQRPCHMLRSADRLSARGVALGSCHPPFNGRRRRREQYSGRPIVNGCHPERRGMRLRARKEQPRSRPSSRRTQATASDGRDLRRRGWRRKRMDGRSRNVDDEGPYHRGATDRRPDRCRCRRHLRLHRRPGVRCQLWGNQSQVRHCRQVAGSNCRRHGRWAHARSTTVTEDIMDEITRYNDSVPRQTPRMLDQLPVLPERDDRHELAPYMPPPERTGSELIAEKAIGGAAPDRPVCAGSVQANARSSSTKSSRWSSKRWRMVTRKHPRPNADLRGCRQDRACRPSPQLAEAVKPLAALSNGK